MFRLPNPEPDWNTWINTLLANPTGPPTIAISIAAFFGFKFALPKLNLAFKTLEDTAGDIVTTAKDIIDEKVVEPLQPVTTFASDIKSCFSFATWNNLWIPGYSEPKFISCMAKKGYAGNVIAEALRKL